MSDAFPSSAYPPVLLARPLGLFGTDFRVEVSTPLSLGPDAVLRASIGRSLLSLIRESGLEVDLRALRYALFRKHTLRPKTRGQILRMMGAMAPMVAAVLDGASADDLPAMGDWEALAVNWKNLSESPGLLVLVGQLQGFDQVALAARTHFREGRLDEATTLLNQHFGDALVDWQAHLPGLGGQVALLLETSLRTLAAMERTFRGHDNSKEAAQGAVLGLLDPTQSREGHSSVRRKPLGNWFADVRQAFKCANNRELEGALGRGGVLHLNRAIDHNQLKKWASVQPGKLMPLSAMQAMLTVLTNPTQRESLQTRFAVARFLTFACDLVRSSVPGEPPAWADVQLALMSRYRTVYRRHTEAEPMVCVSPSTSSVVSAAT